MKKLVIYHGGNCYDGFTAAWLFGAAFPDAEFRPAQHGEEPPDVREREVYMVDFSYPRAVMARLVEQCRGNLVVLDHHKTAEADLRELRAACLCNSDGLDIVPTVEFCLLKSGARLAWEFLYASGQLSAEWLNDYTREVAPWLVDYTEDRDLWLWKLPHSREINAALRSYSFDFKVWNKMRYMSPHAFVGPGEAILRAEQRIVETHVRNAAEIELDGHKVLAVNATTLTSEIAGELAKDRPFGACYFDRADGFRIWSLRARESGVDVSEIAKRRGGGGHRSAAGFQEDTRGAA